MDFDEFINRCERDFYLEIGLEDNQRLDPITKQIVEAKFRQCYSAGFNEGVDWGNKKSKEVYMKDLFGNVVDEFKSVRQAARHIGGDASNISRVLNSKQHTAYGYTWTYKDEENEKDFG